jgi:hypothetical protein
MNFKHLTVVVGSVLLLSSAAISQSAYSTQVAQRNTNQQTQPSRTPPANAQPVRQPTKGEGCACPYDLNAQGNQCGRNSSWSKPGGKSPICYTTDKQSSSNLFTPGNNEAFSFNAL